MLVIQGSLLKVTNLINVIVGAGFSGAVLASLIANNTNEKVIVVDRRDVVGGNCHDYLDDNSITVHKYGPHIFHTNDKKVWDYLSKFTKWHLFYLKSNVIIEGNCVTLPFNLTTIRDLFSQQMADKFEQKLISKYGYGKKIPILDLKNNSDEDLKFIADFVYENVFKNYTMKQWGLRPEEIDPSVTARVPVYISYDNRYFQDKYQGIPQKGYTSLIKNMLDHKNVEVLLNTDYKDFNVKADRVFYTGAIDEFFDYKFGELPYRSLAFDVQVLDKEYFQKTAITNYPNDYDFTRITEHKYFLDEKSNKTVISIEYPQKFVLGENERYYPIQNEENQKLYNRYLEESKKLDNVYFLGRLGDYKYYNMDLTVARAIEMYDSVFGKAVKITGVKNA